MSSLSSHTGLLCVFTSILAVVNSFPLYAKHVDAYMFDRWASCADDPYAISGAARVMATCE